MAKPASVAKPEAAAWRLAPTPSAAARPRPCRTRAVPLISVPGAASACAGQRRHRRAADRRLRRPNCRRADRQPARRAAAAPAAARAAAAPAATPRRRAAAPAAGANALVLNVREDSWIEVRPAKGGAPLISRLVKAGSTETVNVDQPVRVTVGNPGGVTATLRGAAVALPPAPGKTLSRVNLQ